MAGARTKAPRQYERSSPGALFLCEVHTASTPIGRWMNGVLIVYGKAVDAVLYLGSPEVAAKRAGDGSGDSLRRKYVSTTGFFHR
jgi:hypothetical protein